jgi:uncharacterized protein (DUF1697 family)
MVRTFVVLLRGVMPTGKNRTPMAQLREVLNKAGFKNAQTYIQSGNVVLRTDLSPRALEQRVHDLIKKHIGPDLVIVARTASQLEKVLDGNPFKKLDISRVFYTLFEKRPTPEAIRALAIQDYSPEKLVITDEAAYLFIPGSAARSTLSNNVLERKLGVSCTTRNTNTLRALVEIARGL